VGKKELRVVARVHNEGAGAGEGGGVSMIYLGGRVRGKGWVGYLCKRGRPLFRE